MKKLPAGIRRRIDKVEKALGLGDEFKIHDVGAFLSGGRKVVFARVHQLMRAGAERRGPRYLEMYEARHEARKQLLRDRRDRALYLAPLEALGLTSKEWVLETERVEKVLDAYHAASPEERIVMTWCREHLIDEVRELPWDEPGDVLEANR